MEDCVQRGTASTPASNFRMSLLRRAFTVLELLVTIAIMGLLLGLLVPALMAARESARRVQCSSNLREIGLGIQQHHGATDQLPTAWTAPADGVSGYGWGVAILPFLEKSGVHPQIHSKLPLTALQNDNARSTDLPIMRCPSDISDPTFDLLPEYPASTASSSSAESGSGEKGWSLVRLPIANYQGVFGTLEADDTFPAPAGDGAIISDRKIRFSDLERGQSHTLIVGERTTAMIPSTWLGVDFRGEDAACRLVGATVTSPNCEVCDECEYASRHSGGANFVWADGHVTLVASDIDSKEYQQLAKRRFK
jgi:prepilin-type processing-associated H-X9-DG protein/prepilin-type N-terminal cleavage/methylation domain-containing protein